MLVGFLLITPVLSKIKFSWAMAVSLAVSVVNITCNNDAQFLASSRFFTYLPWFVTGFYCTGEN